VSTGWTPHPSIKGHVLVVEDDQPLRDALGPLLEEDGYEVSLAANGREALRRLYEDPLPNVILLDLRMPVMDGWQFRTIQKDDPRLGLIPVIAISADDSAQAAAISAEAYLRKPVSPNEILGTIKRVLIEAEHKRAQGVGETERLTSLGRLAAGVGHEINNPLAFVVLNLEQSLDSLRSALVELRSPGGMPPHEIEARLVDLVDMLEDCRVGSGRIRETVGNLQRLSRQGPAAKGSVVDVQKLVDQSVSMAWNHIRHRATLVKSYDAVATVHGNGTALGQVFLNLLINAAQSIPEGEADRNEIRIATRLEACEGGRELVVEIADSGKGIAAEVLPHVFEPFFTTKPQGQGTGLGLSVSRETIKDHGGRMTVESMLGKGTTFRVFLPLLEVAGTVRPITPVATPIPMRRGRVLVIDDEPLVGRGIQVALKHDHEVVVVQRASEAIGLLERGVSFDLILCDLVMPDVSGPQFHDAVLERWPALVARMVFMTGGAFTPETTAFVERVPGQVLAKPFRIEKLRELVEEFLKVQR
jgi:signal transduction histidine kinase